MNRDEIIALAEKAVFGSGSSEIYDALDTVIHETADQTGKPVQLVADQLRMEAFAGGHYRGARFDRNENVP